MSRISDITKPEQQLAALLGASGCTSFLDPRFARYLDSADPLAHMRNHFAIPSMNSMAKIAAPDDDASSTSARKSNAPDNAGGTLGPDVLAKLLREGVNRQLEAESIVKEHPRRASATSPFSSRMHVSPSTSPYAASDIDQQRRRQRQSNGSMRRRSTSTSSVESVDLRTADEVRRESMAAVGRISNGSKSIDASYGSFEEKQNIDGETGEDLQSDSADDRKERIRASVRRENFNIPHDTEMIVYLAGNSLGLQSRASAERIAREQAVWNEKAVTGWSTHTYSQPWTGAPERLAPMIAGLVGAKESEVATMGTLTANLHLLLCAFYRPTKDRFKIMFEKKAFPSDHYAFASQAEMHGLDISSALSLVGPRKDEYTLRTEDILDRIEKEGHQVAIVFFSGVNYFSGQVFEMEKITAAAHRKGCLVGWDLAHGIGNIPVKLHDWGADFAVWCTYKYLNSGPGGIGGLYVHERHADRPRLSGWWGNKLDTRFHMEETFDPAPGAAGFVTSTPSVLATASLAGSLDTFLEIGKVESAQQEMPSSTTTALKKLRKKSVQMTGYLYLLMKASKYFVPLDRLYEWETGQTSQQPIGSCQAAQWRGAFTVITPDSHEHRGAQISVLLLPRNHGMLIPVNDLLQQAGVYGDEREPDVIRFAPIPLYNTHRDCWMAVKALEWAIKNAARSLQSHDQSDEPGRQ